MTAIPAIPQITVEPRPLNPRLWELVELEQAGLISTTQKLELDCLFRALESGQDMDRRNV